MAKSANSFLRKVVKEEMRRLIKEAGEAAAWRVKLPQGQWEDFGNFIKARISNTIPADVTGAAVVPYLDANPKATSIGKVSATGGGGMQRDDLVDFFHGSRQVADLLKGFGEDDAERVKARELAKKALAMGLGGADVDSEEEPSGEEEGNRSGEETLKTIGDLLGISAAGAMKVGDRAEDLVKKLFSKAGINSLKRATPEQEQILFGKTGLVNSVLSDASAEYAQIISNTVAEKGFKDKTAQAIHMWLFNEKVDPLIERKAVNAIRVVFNALAAGGAKPAEAGDMTDSQKEEEAATIALLIIRTIDGDWEEVADEVLKDLADNDNTLSTFQNFVAGKFRKLFDAEEIAAGLKLKRGRPTKAEAEARKAAAAQAVKVAPPAPAATPAKRGPGRPPKSATPVPVAVPAKRKPGRPKKNA